MKIDNYTLALLYGDGHFQVKEGRELFFFSTTHKELADKVELMLINFGIRYSRFNRDFPEGHYKHNYEILEIIEVYDKNLIDYLVDRGFKSEHVEDRIIWDGDFVRGYLETKGTLFTFVSRNSVFWRISFSGKEEEMKYLKMMIKEGLGGNTHEVVQRKEREEYGIISKSYRLNIQSRDTISKVVNFIDCGDVSQYLRQKIDEFKHYHETTPFNMKKKVFKHYKYAVGFMAKELGVVVKGKRGGGGKRGYKPVYLWENNEPIMTFEGWKGAYDEVSKIFKQNLNMNPPIVDDNQK